MDCDDGGQGSGYSACALGSDCGDCGSRTSGRRLQASTSSTVLVSAEIFFSSRVEAEQATSNLMNGVLVSTAALESALKNQFTSDGLETTLLEVAAIISAPVLSSAPPPQAPSPDYTYTYGGQDYYNDGVEEDSSMIIVAAAAGGAGAFFLIVICVIGAVLFYRSVPANATKPPVSPQPNAGLSAAGPGAVKKMTTTTTTTTETVEMSSLAA